MSIQKCDCGGKLEIGWRVFNFNEHKSDTWFDSLEKAEEYYKDMLKEEPLLNWQLVEDIYCNDCDFLSESILRNQKEEL